MNEPKITYRTDQIASVRHCKLNAIQLIQAEEKMFVARHNSSFKAKDVKNLFTEAKLKITAEKWRKAEEFVINEVENKCWEVDGVMEQDVPPFVVHIEDEDGKLCPVFRDHRLVYSKQYQAGESVDLKCKTGFRITGHQHLRCQNGQWDHQEPACDAIHCLKPHFDASVFEVTPLNIQYQYGEQITVSCLQGFKGESVTGICNDTWTWSPSYPNCSSINCPRPVLNASIFKLTPLATEYQFGAQVKVDCYPGYNGSSVTGICNNTWTWSPSNPSCPPISCQLLDLKSDTMVNPVISPHVFGNQVVLSCKDGYTGNDVTIGCNKTGKWPSLRPKCSRIMCKNPFSHYLNVTLTPNKTQYDYEDHVNITCSTGYYGDMTTLSCKLPDKWVGKETSCQKVQCPSINTTENLSSPDRDTLFYYGDEVTFKCKKGYRTSKHSTIKCLASNEMTNRGFWNDSEPTCQGVPCEMEINVQNMVKVPQVNVYRYPDTVKIHCKRGYINSSSNIVQCQDDGTWSMLPHCNGIQCESLPTDPHRVSPNINDTHHYPEIIEVKCTEGYSTNGTSSLKCNHSRLWTFTFPYCKESLDSVSHHSSYGGAIGGGVTAAVVAIVIVIVAILFMRRRRFTKKSDKSIYYKESQNPKDEKSIYSEVRKSGVVFVEENKKNPTSVNINTKNQTYNNEAGKDGGYYDFSDGPQMSKTAVLIKDFYNYIENGRGEGGKLETEFLKFKSGLQNPTTAAIKPGNKIKNKYKNLYAYDETRVVLETTPQCTSDYVNSSYINGYGCLKQYIASQGPQDNTVNEFWRMVLQVDCGKIVMLTNVFEEAKQKCNHYWPEYVGNSNTFEGIVVTLTKEDIYSDFTIRHLKLQRENLKKKVVQFHFTAWPDKDVPKYSSSLVHFRHKVNSTVVPQKGPTIVHCSAGIGRTGTYIALDYVVTEAKKTGYVDVFRCVETLRRQRVNMVQTANQYVFLHDTVLEALMCPNSGIPSKDYPDVYKELMKFDSNKKKHKLQVEYDLLNSMSRKHDEEVFEVGKSAENKSKNRYSNIIPVGTEMPRLTSTVHGHNEYINAVFLPGYKMSRAFVISQMPMETTVIDFWRLVNDYRISVIVMMNSEYDQRDVYWPASMDKPLTLGPFRIEQKKLVTEKAYNMLVLSLTSNHEQRRVNLFQQTFWSEDKTIPDKAEDFFSFITEVEDAHGRESREGPLLVHCLNGCDKSGLYCVLATVIERLRIEQDVDIQHIIKQMRNRRPQIIPCYEQFRFLYDAVIEYLKQFETYANFS